MIAAIVGLAGLAVGVILGRWTVQRTLRRTVLIPGEYYRLPSGERALMYRHLLDTIWYLVGNNPNPYEINTRTAERVFRPYDQAEAEDALSDLTDQDRIGR